jgi:hypothetical protein
VTEHTCMGCLHWDESAYEDIDGMPPSCGLTGEIKRGSELACPKWGDIAIAYRGREVKPCRCPENRSRSLLPVAWVLATVP